MALREVRVMGDPILEKKCKPVKLMTPRLMELIEDMLDTMYEENGVGLAAPQVGVLRQIVVIDIEGSVVEDEEEVDDDALDDAAAESEGSSEEKKVRDATDSELNSKVEFPLVLINPVIVETAGEQTGAEGCLSLPGKVGTVTRPNYVKVKALGPDMKEFTVEGDGLLARALCHEIDHLEGHMYVEKVEGPIRDVEVEQDS